jgi:hypothetical protein
VKRFAFLAFPLVLALGALGIVGLRGGSSSLAADPPGNNGFVKVDDQPLDSIPNNVPHVGCDFRIDFYNYDEGDFTAQAGFWALPPTGRGFLAGGTTFIGGDPAGGGTDFDGSVTVDLSSALANFEPQPQQGFHVFLVVHAPGSIGADVKHKAFWVTGCEAPVTPPPPPPPPHNPPPQAPSAPTVKSQPAFTG